MELPEEQKKQLRKWKLLAEIVSHFHSILTCSCNTRFIFKSQTYYA